MKLRSYLIFFLSTLFVCLAGCSTITKRIYTKLDASSFQSGGLNGRVLVRYVLCGNRDRLSYFENEMRESIIESKAFSDVKMKNVSISCTALANEIPFSEISLSAFPNGRIAEEEYVINLIVKTEKSNTHFLSNVLKIFTFLIVPAKQEFSYKVGIQIQKVGDEKSSNMMILNEDFTVEKSIIPTGSEYLRFTWEKEPVANLLKVAIKKFQEDGHLK